MNHLTKNPLSRLLVLFVGLLLASSLTTACGGGASTIVPPPKKTEDQKRNDEKDPTPAPSLLLAEPASIASEKEESLTILGSHFAPVGGTATVRLLAPAGDTPFAGGTSASLETQGTIEAADRIHTTSRIAGLRETYPAHVEIVLPDGRVARSGAAMLQIRAPQLRTVTPDRVAPALEPGQVTIAGTDLGPAANGVTVHLEAASGRPFLGGASASFVLDGRMGGSNELSATIPDLGIAADATARLSLRYPSGARTNAIDLEIAAPEREAHGDTNGDEFGSSVAIDGKWAVVGKPGADGGRGSATVYQKGANGWRVYSGLFLLGLEPGDALGAAVAISNERIVAGAPGMNDGSGKVYVFELRSVPGPALMRWIAVHTFEAPYSQMGARFGAAVALDRSFLAVGAPGTDLASFVDAGAAHLYRYQVRNGGGYWVTAGSMIDDNPINRARLGSAIDVRDCSVLVPQAQVAVGAPNRSNLVSNRPLIASGGVFVYDYQGFTGTLIRMAKILPTDVNRNDRFGQAVALGQPGSKRQLVAGAPLDDDRGTNAGAAYVFEYDSVARTWEQNQKLTGRDTEAGDHFGSSLALDEDKLLVGAPNAQAYRDAPAAGAVHVFEREMRTWNVANRLHAPEGTQGAKYGTAVALDGDTALIGASGEGAGAAYFYE